MKIFNCCKDLSGAANANSRYSPVTDWAIASTPTCPIKKQTYTCIKRNKTMKKKTPIAQRTMLLGQRVLLISIWFKKPDDLPVGSLSMLPSTTHETLSLSIYICYVTLSNSFKNNVRRFTFFPLAGIPTAYFSHGLWLNSWAFWGRLSLPDGCREVQIFELLISRAFTSAQKKKRGQRAVFLGHDETSSLQIEDEYCILPLLTQAISRGALLTTASLQVLKFRYALVAT